MISSNVAWKKPKKPKQVALFSSDFWKIYRKNYKET